jgi:hypothetical protein
VSWKPSVLLFSAPVSRANFSFSMPDRRDPDESQTRPTSKLSPSWWLGHILPSKARDSNKPNLGDRLRDAALRPPKPGQEQVSDEPETADELRLAVKAANDKERLTGLLMAPCAAIIGILIGSALISNDPAALLSDGSVNKLHVAVSLYQEAMVALLALAVVMLVTAYYRKRLYLAIVMALYGLTVFNLHYWGFGIPYIMVGAWMFVRAYRLQKNLREMTGDTSRFGHSSGPSSPLPSRPRPNRRYTPPTSR